MKSEETIRLLGRLSNRRRSRYWAIKDRVRKSCIGDWHSPAASSQNTWIPKQSLASQAWSPSLRSSSRSPRRATPMRLQSETHASGRQKGPKGTLSSIARTAALSFLVPAKVMPSRRQIFPTAVVLLLRAAAARVTDAPSADSALRRSISAAVQLLLPRAASRSALTPDPYGTCEYMPVILRSCVCRGKPYCPPLFRCSAQRRW